MHLNEKKTGKMSVSGGTLAGNRKMDRRFMLMKTFRLSALILRLNACMVCGHKI